MKKFTASIIIIGIALAPPILTVASEITGGLGTKGVVPIPPPNVQAEKTGDAEITVIWGEVFGDGYRVYRTRVHEGELIEDRVFQRELIGSTNTTYVDDGLKDGSYSYVIEAFIDDLVSDQTPPTHPPRVIETQTEEETQDEDQEEDSQEQEDDDSTSSGGGGGGGGGGGSSATQDESTEDEDIDEETSGEDKPDINKDGTVDILDFNTLMVHWGSTEPGNLADLNGDNVVDILDFNLLMVHWSS